jgi:hypothetical protein
MGEVAKSYMINITNGLLIHLLLIYEENFYLLFYQCRVKTYLHVAACVDTVV